MTSKEMPIKEEHRLTQEKKNPASGYRGCIAVLSIGFLGAVAGCSGGNLGADDRPSDAARAEPLAVPVETAPPDESFVSDPFAGMWDLEWPTHDAEAEGILLIEGPCVYILDDFTRLLPGMPLEELPEPELIFVELPRRQTRYDSETQSIWVHDEGPMTNGDRVQVGGSFASSSLFAGSGSTIPPDICSSDASVWNANSMSPRRCDSWRPLEYQIGCRSNDPDPLAGMWSYNPANPLYVPAAEGVLLIEGPCVYVIDDFMWLVPGVPLEKLPEPVRVFVNLPRAQTRYDPDTETIRVHDQGPMASGDRVQMAGGADRSVPDACSTGVDRVFTATHMSPKQCAPWVPPERQTGCKAPEADRPSDEAGTKWTGTKWEEP